MKAFIKLKYGGPEVLQLEEVEKPLVKEGHILIKVHANSANPADWHIIRGKPFFARLSFGLFKPKNKIAGADFAGIVVAVGKDIEDYKVGDRVFGESLHGGAFATYISVPTNVCAKIPEGVSFSVAAGLPIAGITAFQALYEHGKLQEGESVLINGASGGVGHLCIQIAKSIGANVTGVCSEKNADFVKSLGADKVIAYDKTNIHKHNEKYNLVVDTNGNLDLKDFERMGQRGVVLGFTTMSHMMAVMMASAFSKFSLIQFTAQVNTKDLESLALLVKEAKIKVHIDKSYSYDKIPEAIAYIEAMRTKGKVVMLWEPE